MLKIILLWLVNATDGVSMFQTLEAVKYDRTVTLLVNEGGKYS